MGGIDGGLLLFPDLVSVHQTGFGVARRLGETLTLL